MVDLRLPGRVLRNFASPRQLPVAGGEFNDAVRARLRAAPSEPLLYGRSASVVLDTGVEKVTVDVKDGRLS